MKFILLGALLLSPLLKAQIPGEAEKAKAARAILDSWHQESPRAEERTLHFVLWTPNDREPPAEYQARLTRIMEHIQDFYRKEMDRLGFGPRSIKLPKNPEGGVKIHLIKGEHPTSHYEMDSGSDIRKECLPVLRESGINAEKETLVIFCNLATWDPEKLTFVHKSPYYAGGNYQGGTAWQLDSPELDVTNLSKKEPIIRDGQYGRISLGKHNSIFIGGVCHELGHALGLPHCKERPDEAARGTALMGSGNRSYGDELRGEGKGSFLTLAHALRLASHPQFSGSTKGMNLPVKAEISDLSLTAKGKTIHVSGTLTADPPAYAVVAYFDPDGGSDYNATTATAVPDADGNFTLSCDALPAGKTGELRLHPLYVNGSTGGWMSQTKFRYPYSVGKDGTPDLSTFQFKAILAPIVEALNKRDQTGAQKLADQLDGRAAVIAGNLINKDAQPVATPAQLGDAEGKKFPLTNFKPSQEKIGWGRPAYNHLPNPSLLLESGGKIFTTGIYAHAPARHTYDLGKKFTKFSGLAGLSGSRGSAQFEIKGDGKTLWRSKTLKQGQLANYAVDLTGIETLELLTHPTNDGTGGDWALWLDPVLE
ncbi:MAG: NPCBM/NEW2 domain-containing protein [Akkermansiaceae bacterium]